MSEPADLSSTIERATADLANAARQYVEVVNHAASVQAAGAAGVAIHEVERLMKRVEDLELDVADLRAHQRRPWFRWWRRAGRERGS